MFLLLRQMIYFCHRDDLKVKKMTKQFCLQPVMSNAVVSEENKFQGTVQKSESTSLVVFLFGKIASHFFRMRLHRTCDILPTALIIDKFSTMIIL